MKQIPPAIKLYIIVAILTTITYTYVSSSPQNAVLGTTTKSQPNPKADICNKTPDCSWQEPNCVCSGDAKPQNDPRYNWNEVDLPSTHTPLAMPIITEEPTPQIPVGAVEPEKITSLPVQEKIISVGKVEKVNTDNQSQIIISGQGPANSTIFVYIFSTPTVVEVKTDVDGKWTYTFKNNLEKGEHTVYASTKKNGVLPVRSTAHAFTVVPVANAQATEDFSIVDTTRNDLYRAYLVNCGILLSIGIAGVILLIKVFARKFSYNS